VAVANDNAIALNTWQLATVVKNGPASTFTFYVNGTEEGTTSNSESPNNTADPVRIGIRSSDLNREFDGAIDEVRVSNVARSTSWIATEYANQSLPEEFYEIDPQEPLRGSTASERSLTLSDPRPSQPANHTFNFTVSNSITASTTLVFEYPSGFTFSGGQNWYDNDWGFRKKVEIDRNKVAGRGNKLSGAHKHHRLGVETHRPRRACGSYLRLGFCFYGVRWRHQARP
jgi:hypothetical protein